MKSKKLFLLAPMVFLLALFGWAGGAWAGSSGQVAGGGQYTVVVKHDGTLWAWGKNNLGQLGDGTSVDRNIPVQIGADTDWQSVTAGGCHTLAIKKDGTLWAWGCNVGGRLGDGTTKTSRSPVKIEGEWRIVAAGQSYTVAIKTDGSLWAWGENKYGQLGDGTTNGKNSPVQIGHDYNWQDVAVGSLHAVAIKTNGSLWVWGHVYYSENKYNPVQVGSDTDWMVVAAGDEHAAALKKDNSLWAWGNNYFGQLGDGTRVITARPKQIGIDTDWQTVISGSSHTVAIKADGSLWVWGNNHTGQLGDGTNIDKSQPVQLGTEKDWQGIAVSSMEDPESIRVYYGSYFSHTVAMKKDGSLWTWGNNFSGQLGNGITGSFLRNPSLISNDNDWELINAGYYHTMAIKTDGSLWGWGSNDRGQLGNGTYSDSNIPVHVGGDSHWQHVASGESHTVAIRDDGSLWAWGSVYYGKLGNGSDGSRGECENIPIQVGYDNDWQDAAAGYLHTVAIKTDGSLWAWGYNGDGELGDGTTDSYSLPLKIGDDYDWTNVAAGSSHTMAIKTDGSLWAWGYNAQGQLGDGTTNDRHSPVQIGTDTDWQAVATGNYYTIALKTDGTVWSWGYNPYGGLGDGTTTDRTSPEQIGYHDDWQGVSAGRYHTAALKTDGSIWAWGNNKYGQLGDGTTSSKTIPVQLGTDYDWQTIDAGGGHWYDGGHTVALKFDGSLWAWGNNAYGQIGDGTAWQESPVQVISPDFYTVTPSAGEHGSISPDTPQTVNHGATTSFTVAPDTGYSIDKVEGCGGTLDLSSGIYTTGAITANCAVTASFKINTYIVTPSAGANGGIDPAAQQTVNHGGTARFTVTPVEGYSIDTVTGCGGTLDGNEYTTGAITANCAVTASFKINKYTVTPSAGANGGIDPSAPQAVNHGATASFTVTPNTGYIIEKVEGCGGTLSGSAYTTGAITADCAVTATFVSSTTHIVFPKADRHGSIAPRRPQRVQHGKTVSFTVAPDAGWRIDKVSGCGGSLSGSTYTTGAVTRNCIVRASFKRLQKHFVIPFAGRHGSIAPRWPQRVLEGTAASFIVTPDAGCRIDKVSGCGGSLSGSIYTTGPITRSCIARASFRRN